jgi:hypothetical protein
MSIWLWIALGAGIGLAITGLALIISLAWDKELHRGGWQDDD